MRKRGRVGGRKGGRGVKKRGGEWDGESGEGGVKKGGGQRGRGEECR